MESALTNETCKVTEKLVQQIDEYEFKAALESLSDLKRSWK